MIVDADHLPVKVMRVLKIPNAGLGKQMAGSEAGALSVAKVSEGRKGSVRRTVPQS